MGGSNWSYFLAETTTKAKGTGGRSVRGSIHGEGQHVMHTLEELTAERHIEPSISPERVLLNIYDPGSTCYDLPFLLLAEVTSPENLEIHWSLV